MLRLLLLMLLPVAVSAQPLSRVFYFDEEDGLPHGHATQLLQDRQGVIWIATWNGLCRFDGYEFCTFKSAIGDGSHLTNDRFRDIALLPDDNILCRIDDGYFLFDVYSYTFRDLSADEQQTAADNLQRYRQSTPLQTEDTLGLSRELSLRRSTFRLTDHQGNMWMVGSNGIYLLCPISQRARRLDIGRKSQVRCLFTDQSRRQWVCTTPDSLVSLHADGGERLLGFLGKDGRLHPKAVCFHSSVYTIHQHSDGSLWLGTKPDGLFRLREEQPGHFTIQPIRQLRGESIYDILEDRNGRLWVATLGNGLFVSTDSHSEQPHFSRPAHYPTEKASRMRFLHQTADGRLMGTTTNGLIVSSPLSHPDSMTFALCRREPSCPNSLSSSATMDIAELPSGQVYVSTESGGINILNATSPGDTAFSFRHLLSSNHLLPGDVIHSLTRIGDNRLLAVGSNIVSIVDSTAAVRVFDYHHFGADYRFSDAHPQQLSDSIWLFGLFDGAMRLDLSRDVSTDSAPRLVLTGVSIEGGTTDHSILLRDTLVLGAHERNLSVTFAAIDYRATGRIAYAFRLSPHDNWTPIGKSRTVPLFNLSPGTYHLEFRSTNADGQWADNVRRLCLVVTPSFWQSATGHLLLLLIIAAIIATVAYTLLYIKRIRRQQHDALEAYLSLLHQIEQPAKEETSGSLSPTRIKPEDDAMLKRVMAYIEQNLGNSEANIGDMATAAGASRSGLQRKLKQTMGITPQDLLREARMKHASTLLKTTGKSIAEVAYACGFTDPKYFSRSFKQCTGSTPSEVRQ